MDCPKCGYAMPELDTECSRCKRMAASAAPPAPPDEQPQPEQMRTAPKPKRLIGAMAVAAAMVVVVALLLFQRGSGKATGSAPTTTTTAGASFAAAAAEPAQPAGEAQTTNPVPEVAEPTTPTSGTAAPGVQQGGTAAPAPVESPASGAAALAQLTDDEFAWMQAQMFVVSPPKQDFGGNAETVAFFYIVAPNVDDNEQTRALLGQYGVTADEYKAEYQRRMFPPELTAQKKNNEALLDKWQALLPQAKTQWGK